MLAAVSASAGDMHAVVPASASVSTSSKLETEIHAGYHSIYEFRGVDFGADLYEAGVDFSYELAEGLSLSGGAWWAENDAFDELDLYVGLTKTLGPVDVSVGYIGYVFPGDTEVNTSEIYLGVAHELACGVGLSLTYYEDVDEIDGSYLEFGASKSYELSESISIDLGAGAAWSFDYNNDINGTTLSGFNHWYASVALPWEIKEDVILTPYIKYTDAASDLDSDVDAVNSDDLFIGGITLSVAF